MWWIRRQNINDTAAVNLLDAGVITVAAQSYRQTRTRTRTHPHGHRHGQGPKRQRTQITGRGHAYKRRIPLYFIAAPEPFKENESFSIPVCLLTLDEISESAVTIGAADTAGTVIPQSK